MTLQHAMLLSTLIAKSRRICAHVSEEIKVLEEMGLMDEALAKANYWRTHKLRIVRYSNKLIQHEA